MRVDSTFSLRPSSTAPDFALPNASGKIVTLDEARGSLGTIVFFACNHCPYVIHLASELGEFADRAAALRVETICINSNDLAAYPQDGPEFMKEFAATHKWNFPYLIDETQAIAKAYGAACTPDFFLFDENLALFYAGQFDDSRPKNGSFATGSDLQEAIDRMLDGEAPPTSTKPASGCNIKWKPGQEPQWFCAP